MDSQLRLDVGDLKLGGRRFAPADSLQMRERRRPGRVVVGEGQHRGQVRIALPDRLRSPSASLARSARNRTISLELVGHGEANGPG